MPSNDAQVAAHFSNTRPILGICLKRYYMTNNGKSMKRMTHVDIPLEIGLPHFISDDEISANGPAFGNFKLSLQSVVFHQGLTTESGHYISIVRSPEPGSEGVDKWLRFDDLASERVVEIDVESFLKESSQQTPYLLFYQVIPIGVNEDPPPSYADSLGSRDSIIELLNTKIAENSRPSVELNSNRISLDSPSSDEGPRGRQYLPSSTDSATDSGSADIPASPPTSSPPTSAPKSVPQTEPFPTLGVPLESGPNSLTASRRGSKTSNNTNVSTPTATATPTSKSRDQSRTGERLGGGGGGEKRLSASLSRLVSRMSKDGMGGNGTFPSGPPLPTSSSAAASPNGTPRPSSEASRKLARTVQQAHEHSAAKAAAGSGEDGKHHGHGHGHHHERLTKSGKPDRECGVM